MTGSGDARVSATATEWRRESRYYRRTPGLGWLLGLLLIPLLLGLIGWGTLGKPKVSVSAPSISERCEIDLSPGTPRWPLRETAGSILTCGRRSRRGRPTRPRARGR